MKKYSLIFGAGADVSYDMPLGNDLVIDIISDKDIQSSELFNDIVNYYRDKAEQIEKRFKEIYRMDFSFPQNVLFTFSEYSSILHSTIRNTQKKLVTFEDKSQDITEIYNLGIEHKLNEFLEKLSLVVYKNDILKELYTKIDEYGTLDIISDEEYKRYKVYYESLIMIAILYFGEDFYNLFTKIFDMLKLQDRLFKISYENYAISILKSFLKLQKPSESSEPLIKKAHKIISNLFDYEILVENIYTNIINPRSPAKFMKSFMFQYKVWAYFIRKIKNQLNIKRNNEKGNLDYYRLFKDYIEGLTVIGTTNYTPFVQRIMDVENRKIYYLNGSIYHFYDPFENSILEIRFDVEDDEKEIWNTIVEKSRNSLIMPLMITQTPLKPFTAFEMMKSYVEFYEKLKDTCIFIIGHSLSRFDNNVISMINNLIIHNKVEKIIIINGDVESTKVFKNKAKVTHIKFDDKTKEELVKSIKHNIDYCL